MASKHCVILLLLFVAVTISGAQVYYQPKEPVYANIPISDPSIQDIGRFAVDEYNKQGKSYLYFKEVYGGYLYIPNPAYYTSFTLYLDLKASNCSQYETLGNYTAVVQLEAANHGKRTFLSLTLK